MEPTVWAIIGVSLLLWIGMASFDRTRTDAAPPIFLGQSCGRHAAAYRRLCGSHIALLKGLQRNGGWATCDDLRVFFARAGRNWRGGDGSFEGWFEALTASGYVEVVPNGEAQLAMITPFGVDFVRWLQSSRVPELKPG